MQVLISRGNLASGLGIAANMLLLFPWMEFGVGLFQVGDREAEVALRGGQGTMPQEFLHVPQVGVILNEMGSASVAPYMRGHDLLDPGRLRMLFYQGAESMGIQRIAPVGNKEPVGVTAAEQLRARLAQIALQ